MDYLGNLEIEKVIGREIVDSRGNPTVELVVYLEEEQLQVVLLPVSLRLLNFVMEIRLVTMGKVFLRQLRTLIQL